MLSRNPPYLVATSWYRTVLETSENRSPTFSNEFASPKWGLMDPLGIKIISYIMIQEVRRSAWLTFHQIKLQLSGQRQTLSIISDHFHELNAQEHL